MYIVVQRHNFALAYNIDPNILQSIHGANKVEPLCIYFNVATAHLYLYLVAFSVNSRLHLAGHYLIQISRRLLSRHLYALKLLIKVTWELSFLSYLGMLCVV